MKNNTNESSHVDEQMLDYSHPATAARTTYVPELNGSIEFSEAGGMVHRPSDNWFIERNGRTDDEIINEALTEVEQCPGRPLPPLDPAKSCADWNAWGETSKRKNKPTWTRIEAGTEVQA